MRQWLGMKSTGSVLTNSIPIERNGMLLECRRRASQDLKAHQRNDTKTARSSSRNTMRDHASVQ